MTNLLQVSTHLLQVVTSLQMTSCNRPLLILTHLMKAFKLTTCNFWLCKGVGMAGMQDCVYRKTIFLKKTVEQQYVVVRDTI